jgi:tRNA (guanine-N7-)-methyltransferase
MGEAGSGEGPEVGVRRLSSAATGYRQVRGRHKGKPLRPGQQARFERLLPQLRVDLAETEALPRPLWLEIGFGAGEHLAAQAAARPDVTMLGCETFVNGIAGLLTQVEARKLGNVRVFPDDANLLLPMLPEAAVSRAFLLFLDPWPKSRHHKRRFVQPASLDHLARVLEDDAELRFASDHPGYVAWTLALAQQHPAFAWTARAPEDWRQRPDDAVMTRYEVKALGRGARCYYLTLRRRPRA